MALHDRAAMQFKDDLLERIQETGARGLAVDLAALDVVDSFIAKLIGDIAEVAALGGTRVVVSGLRPAVAIALVELGVELRGVTTALNLEKAIRILRRGGLNASPRSSREGAVDRRGVDGSGAEA
jgi:rsbT antagonist protein RsbS